jgi:hypothetical protein
MPGNIVAEPAPTSTAPVVFDRPAALRVQAAVLYVERMIRGGKPLPDLADRANRVAGRLAFTGAGGIPARSGTTAGTATVTEVYLTGTTLSTTANTFTAINMSAQAVGASRYIGVTWRAGAWHCDWEDC